MSDKIVKGFKAFNKGLICNNFQYKEGETYELKEGEKLELCQKGFHYCENPLDVFDFYDITESEFSEVEALGDIKKDNTRSVTSKIKIGVKLDLKSFIYLSIKCLIDICKVKPNASSGYSSTNASSGYSSKNEMTGNDSVSVSAGANSIVKGKIGCFFCLTEWKDGKPIGIKSGKIDGKRVKEDTWYKLIDGKLQEVK